MKKILEGSRAIAETINACSVGVVSAYPITPQTHIVEDLAKLKADGEAKFEYVRAESEFAAISIVEGSAATGVRTYTATSSQGLLLMTEVLFNVAGMRLPIVMTCANRAVSAPINIWCFSKEADVLMADLTYRPINRVKVGDLVLGKDKKGNLVYTKVKKLYQRETGEAVRLKTDQFDLTCTPGHEFYYHPAHSHWTKANNLAGKKLHYFGYGFETNENFKRGWLSGVADGDGCFYSQGNRFGFRLKVKDEEMVNAFVRWSNSFGFSVAKKDYLEKDGYFVASLTMTKECRKFKDFLKEKKDKDFYRGYLAGMYDAEGTGPFKIKQAVIYGNSSEAIDRVVRYLKLLKFSFKVYVDKRSENYHVKINNVPEFFIQCRPIIKRKRDNLLRMTLKSVKSRLEVSAVEPMNKKTKVYNLETDVNNYIVNGLLVHNCDQQDAVTMRDAGWLMWFGEDNQEVCDLHILAYKIAEKMMLPVMVNLDGFVLTHVVEPVEIEDEKKIARFLPSYDPKGYKLDPKDPKTMGAFATPSHYFEIRKDLHDDVVASKALMVAEMKNFKKIFSRDLNLVEYYGDSSADTVLVAMGSVIGTMKDTADELKAAGERVGILKIVSLRPFADQEVQRALRGAKNVAVIDKSISLGTEGILATELRRVLGDSKKIVSFVAGLGGRDITKDTVKNIYSKVKSCKERVVFVNE